MKQLLLVGAFAAIAGTAHAYDFTNTTKCSALNTIMAPSEPDMDDVRDAGHYIENIFYSLDSKHVENGEPGVTSDWTDQATTNNVASVMVWCSKYPRETVYNATAEVYNGIRDIEMQFGTAH